MIDWVKSHPYLTGILVLGLIVLFFVFRRVTSGSTAVPTTQQGVDPAVLAAQVQAQTVAAQAAAHTQDLQAALAAKNTDANLALQIQSLQNQNNKDLYEAQLKADEVKGNQILAQIKAQAEGSVTVIRAQGDANAKVALAQGQADVARIDAQGETAIAVAQIQTGGAVQIAGIQAAQLNHASDNQLAAQKDIDAASVASVNIQTQGAVTIAGVNAGAQVDIAKLAAEVQQANIAAGKDVALSQIAGNIDIAKLALQLGLDQDATAALINRQNNETAQFAIATQGQIDVTKILEDNTTARFAIQSQADLTRDYIDQSANIANRQIDLQWHVDDSILQQLGYGNFNRGGQGGANQVSVVGGLFGFPTLGDSSQNVQAVDARSNGIGAILTGISGIVSGLFGAPTSSLLGTGGISGRGTGAGGSGTGIIPPVNLPTSPLTLSAPSSNVTLPNYSGTSLPVYRM